MLADTTDPKLYLDYWISRTTMSSRLGRFVCMYIYREREKENISVESKTWVMMGSVNISPSRKKKTRCDAKLDSHVSK